ncbi:MAG: hypothetical protein CSA38_03995 [Flavobacteriales bacterium]|nr:MAG: hypothetical protein CSA38_03995 [Flavobacteriales bacterium]
MELDKKGEFTKELEDLRNRILVSALQQRKKRKDKLKEGAIKEFGDHRPKREPPVRVFFYFR